MKLIHAVIESAVWWWWWWKLLVYLITKMIPSLTLSDSIQEERYNHYLIQPYPTIPIQPLFIYNHYLIVLSSITRFASPSSSDTPMIDLQPCSRSDIAPDRSAVMYHWSTAAFLAITFNRIEIFQQGLFHFILYVNTYWYIIWCYYLKSEVTGSRTSGVDMAIGAFVQSQLLPCTLALGWARFWLLLTQICMHNIICGVRRMPTICLGTLLHRYFMHIWHLFHKFIFINFFINIAAIWREGYLDVGKQQTLSQTALAPTSDLVQAIKAFLVLQN